MEFFKPEDYRHVNYSWDDAYANSLDAVDRLVISLEYSW